MHGLHMYMLCSVIDYVSLFSAAYVVSHVMMVVVQVY